MRTKTLIVVLTLMSSSLAKVEFLSDEFIQTINSQQTSWVAGRNFHEDTPAEDLQRLCGSLEEPESVKNEKLKTKFVNTEAIPDNFDGRTYWSQCESLNDIRNQGGCGSCWAFAAVEVLTDRLCIATNGEVKFKFSPEDVMTCCSDCGTCDGGTSSRVMNYWIQNGLVSGGDYDSKEGCQPYSAGPYKNGEIPACSTSCLNHKYKTPYSEDKHFGSESYHIDQDELQIQNEILESGPVKASFIVYQDFYSYQSGVYTHSSGNKTGSHAVKIVGWGTENGHPYWLVANSWGQDWGGLGGFFKILRGENHCGIESNIWGATPKL